MELRSSTTSQRRTCQTDLTGNNDIREEVDGQIHFPDEALETALNKSQRTQRDQQAKLTCRYSALDTDNLPTPGVNSKGETFPGTLSFKTQEPSWVQDDHWPTGSGPPQESEPWLQESEPWLQDSEPWPQGSEPWLQGSEPWPQGLESWLQDSAQFKEDDFDPLPVDNNQDSDFPDSASQNSIMGDFFDFQFLETWHINLVEAQRQQYRIQQKILEGQREESQIELQHKRLEFEIEKLGN